MKRQFQGPYNYNQLIIWFRQYSFVGWSYGYSIIIIHRYSASGALFEEHALRYHDPN